MHKLEFLKLIKTADTLEHIDPSIKCTKGICQQCCCDPGSGVGNSFEFDIPQNELDQINALIDPLFNLRGK